MDPAKTACDMVLTWWKETAKYRKYIRSLGDNLAGLQSKMLELDGVYEDVRMLVERAEGEGWRPKSDAARWLTKVEDLKKEVDRILAEGEIMMGKSCLCGLCFINCRARYKQSEVAEAKRASLETELAQRCNFRVKEDVAYEPADLILRKSLRALEDKSGELLDIFEMVKLRVKREEEQHMVRTPEVGGWLRRVEDLLEKEVVEILEQGKVEMEKVRSHGGAGDDSQIQRNFGSYHGISKHADEKRAMLEGKLKEGRCFVVFAYKPDNPLVVEMPIERLVGAESTFKDVWSWVEDESVKCIGLCGMGGTGKTHLLDRVHNQFLQVTHDYDFVLRVIVSRPVNLSKIQEAILVKPWWECLQWNDPDSEQVFLAKFQSSSKNYRSWIPPSNASSTTLKVSTSDFWTLKAPGDCSWSWRKILQLREQIRPFISYKVGPNLKVSFWHDNWLPVGPLFSYRSRGYRCVPSILPNASVSTVFRYGLWRCPRSADPQASGIFQLSASLATSPHDEIIWTPIKSGTFTTKNAWTTLREPSEKLSWTKRIWFSGNIPRASLLSWLAWQDRLTTKDRMLRWNVVLQSEKCEFCENQPETRDHLFFSCNFTRHTWQETLKSAGLRYVAMDWTTESRWLMSKRGKTIDSMASRLLCTQYIHTIWMGRNKRIFYRRKKTEEELTRSIVGIVKLKLSMLLRLEHQLKGSKVAISLGLIGT